MQLKKKPHKLGTYKSMSPMKCIKKIKKYKPKINMESALISLRKTITAKSICLRLVFYALSFFIYILDVSTLLPE